MMFDGKTAALIFLIQLLGYIVKGLVGFGNPLIAAPLLSMITDNAVIAPGTLLLDAPINACIAWRGREKFRWRSVLPLLLAVLAGVIPGVLLLKLRSQWIIKALLGVLVLGLGAEMAAQGRRPPGPERRWVRLPVAFVSGVCAGLFGINMMIVAYLKRTARNYEEFKGSLCFLFLAENIFRLAVYWTAGFLTEQVLWLAAVTAPAALGVAAGTAVSARMPEEVLHRCAVAMFLLSGASILVKALVFRV